MRIVTGKTSVRTHARIDIEPYRLVAVRSTEIIIVGIVRRKPGKYFVAGQTQIIVEEVTRDRFRISVRIRYGSGRYG